MNNNTFIYFATKTRLKREMVIPFYFLYFNYNFSILQSRDLPRDRVLGEGEEGEAYSPLSEEPDVGLDLRTLGS